MIGDVDRMANPNLKMWQRQNAALAPNRDRRKGREQRGRNARRVPQSAWKTMDYLFFVGFLAVDAGPFAAAAAGCSLGSGIFANAMICVWMLSGALGRAG